MTTDKHTGSKSMDAQRRAGSLRPSQIITTMGPGAIYDTTNDSVMIRGIDFWSNRYFTEFEDTRLIAMLRKIHRFRKVASFRSPYSSGSHLNVPVITFPRWGECPRCNKLSKRNGHPDFFNLYCPDCRNADGERISTHPARLVIACKNGHIDDFPWKRWVPHSRDDCGSDKLYLRKGADTVSLEGLKVECTNCGQSKSLALALAKKGVSQILKYCPGLRPWLGEPEKCDEVPRGLLKGASNVYFASLLRGLSIPPFVHPLYSKLKEYRQSLSLCQDDPGMLENLVEKIRSKHPDLGEKYSTDSIIAYLRSCFSSIEKQSLERGIKIDEWDALNYDGPQDEDDFATEPIPVPDRFSSIISKLVVVRRLKETIVLKGFSRIDSIDPDDPEPPGIAELCADEPTWLPAIENHGEGIFLSFNEDFLKGIDSNDQIISRNNSIMMQFDRMRRHRVTSNRYPPRYIFLHSLSHLLIRELSNYTGYSSSSIREKVYGQNDMGGILLYTSSSSSDGSLGGLASIGKTGNTFGVIMDMSIRKSIVCSSDPLCSMNHPDVTERENGSACHACLFLPEISCEAMNKLLDRSTIRYALKGYLSNHNSGLSGGFGYG